jgi:hypothetical protein
MLVTTWHTEAIEEKRWLTEMYFIHPQIFVALIFLYQL